MQKMIRKIIITLLFFTLTEAQARWATPEEVLSEIKYYNSDVKINKDGSEENTVEAYEVIIKEGGRDKAANYTLTYNEGTSQLKIIEAYTIVGKNKYPVKAEMIEDKPLASSPQGFDQERQVLISFPNIEIGSGIYVKYQYKSKPLINDFYSARFWFASQEYWHAAKLNITSEIPLNLYINDPNKVLDIEEKTKDHKYYLNVKLKKPLCNVSIASSEVGRINAKHYTWVTVSTIKNWNDLAMKISPKYEAVINQPLPSLFEVIKDKALQEKNEIAQMNMVTKLLSDKIQYMGDWRSIDGKFFPRNLDEIASSQIGDCKDFSVSTAAILTKLGYQVHGALVDRGVFTDRFDDLPHLGNFNHAFTKVTSKTGKVYWIDPTNMVSMAQGIFPDIADKKVLVLDSKKPSYEKTPLSAPQFSQKVFEEEVEIKGEKLHVSGRFTFTGNKAIPLTGALLNSSEQDIKDQIYYNASGGKYLKEENKKGIVLPDLTSKIVQDLNIKVKYIQDNELILTTLGKGLLIKSIAKKKLVSVPGQISDLYLGGPAIDKYRICIIDKALNPLKSPEINYNKDTKWINIKREVTKENGKVCLEEEVIIKGESIPNEELQSVEYQNLEHDLRKYFNDFVLILKE
jgi:hypothetical protein